MTAQTHVFIVNALNQKAPAIRTDQRGAKIGVYAVVVLAIAEALAGFASYLLA